MKSNSSFCFGVDMLVNILKKKKNMVSEVNEMVVQALGLKVLCVVLN
jgi:hypothetical protein